MNKRCGAGLRCIALVDLGFVFLWLKCVSGLEDTGAGEKHIRERHKDDDTQ